MSKKKNVSDKCLIFFLKEHDICASSQFTGCSSLDPSFRKLPEKEIRVIRGELFGKVGVRGRLFLTEGKAFQRRTEEGKNDSLKEIWPWY